MLLFELCCQSMTPLLIVPQLLFLTLLSCVRGNALVPASMYNFLWTMKFYLW